MNYLKLENKISNLVNTLVGRGYDVASRRKEVSAKLKVVIRVLNSLEDEFELIVIPFSGTGEWYDMLDDLDAEISDLSEELEELSEELNQYDDAFFDIEGAFENVVTELETGVAQSKRS